MKLTDLIIYPPSHTVEKIYQRIRRIIIGSGQRLKYESGKYHLSDEQFKKAVGDQTVTAALFRPVLSLPDSPDDRTFFRESCPEYREILLEKAKQVLAHRFDLLGSGDQDFGEEINWHADFIHHHIFTKSTFYQDIHPASYPGGYDIVVPWELSRCQHLGWLGQAYWYTGDEVYTQEFIAQIKDWIDQNPFMQGVNWASTMDVALRAVNWLIAFDFFKRSSLLDQPFIDLFIKSLLLHGQYIRENLEYNLTHRNNHYVSDLVGLLCIAYACPFMVESGYWLSFALAELDKEIGHQVFPDGMVAEESNSYHRFATELFMFGAVIAQKAGKSYSQPNLVLLKRMIHFIGDITQANGKVSLIGDGDNGRAYRLKVYPSRLDEWVDMRALLAAGAVFFANDQMASKAGTQIEEALWIFGSQAASFFKELKTKRIFSGHEGHLKTNVTPGKAYPDGGIYILGSSKMLCIVHTGPQKHRGFGHHSHNDLLSFSLSTDEEWIVDPGVFTYTGDYEDRNSMRKTCMHNTAVINGDEQSHIDPKKPFVMGNRPRMKILDWQNKDGMTLLDARLSGFHSRNFSRFHRRRFIFNSLTDTLLIEDSFSGSGRDAIELFFHFSADVKINTLSAHRFELTKPGKSDHLLLECKSDQLFDWEITQNIICPGYGTKFPAPVLRISGRIVQFSSRFSIFPPNAGQGTG